MNLLFQSLINMVSNHISPSHQTLTRKFPLCGIYTEKFISSKYDSVTELHVFSLIWFRGKQVTLNVKY
jgi:hypothetical protein